MPEPELDENGQPKVAPKVKLEPAVDSKEGKVEKLSLTPEELDSQIKAGVAVALAENEARVREEEAKLQGNYKLLAEKAEDALRKSNLALWRTRALNKHKLPEVFFDALSGETEDEILESAKKLKKHFDAEIEARTKVLNEEAVPPHNTQRGNSVRAKSTDTDLIARSIIQRDLGIGHIN